MKWNFVELEFVVFKKIFAIFLCLIFSDLASAKGSSSSGSVQEPILKVGVTSSPLYPYWGGSTKLPKGIIHDIASLMEKQMKVDIQYVAFNTLAEIKEAVALGKIDLAIGYIKTADNKDQFLFSNPIYKDEIVGWIDDAAKAKAQNVDNLKWACIKGSSHCTVLEQIGVDSIRQVATSAELHEQLNSNDVDALIGFYSSFLYQFKVNSNDEQKMYFDERFGSIYSRVLMNKENYDLKKMIDNFIFEVKHYSKSDVFDNFYFKHSNNRDVYADWYDNDSSELVIRYSIDEDVFPYSYIDEKTGNYVGFIHDFFDSVEAITPLEFEYVPPGEQDITEMLLHGVIDVVPIAKKESYSTKLFSFTDDIIDVKYTLIEKTSIDGVDKFGVLDRFSNLENDTRAVGYTIYDDVDSILSDFQSGAINHAYLNKYLVDLIIRDYKDLEFKVNQTGVGVNLDTKAPMLLRRGDDQLKEMVESAFSLLSYGEINRIWKDYNKVNYHIGYDKEEIKKFIYFILLVLLPFAIFVFSYLRKTRKKLIGRAHEVKLSEAQRKFLHDIIDNIPSYICIRDVKGEILLSNKEFSDFYHACDCQKNECMKVFFDNSRLNMAGDFSENIEVTDSSHPLFGRYFHIENKSITDYVDKKEFFMTILSDVTEVKERENYLQQARQNAESLAQQKQHFLAVVSHELRTPISGILGLMELLGERLEDKFNREILHNASMSTSKLKLLVDDILDFSKLEAKQLSVTPELVNLPKEISPIIRSFDVLAERKGLRFYLDWKPSRFFEAEVDILRVSQVISNILSNAIKFTENGAVSCFIRLEENSLLIRVEDQGIGMDAAELQNIFAPFVQAQNTIARKFGGTGLGMSIVKNLVEMMGGTISVSSEKYIGTNVTVVIPVKTTEFVATDTLALYEIEDHNIARWLDVNQIGYRLSKPEHQREESNFYPSVVVELLAQQFETTEVCHCISEMSMLSGKVLVVDDDPVNRFLVQLQLEALGLEAEIVADSSLALERISEQNLEFGAVISDLHMPDINGFELAQKIKVIVPELPVILCTADNSIATFETAKSLGIDSIVFKPYELVELYNVLMLYFAQQEGEAWTTEELSELKPQSVNSEWLPHLKKENRVEMTQAIIGSLEQALHELGSEHAQIKTIAHRLKGSAGSLSLPSIAEACLKLEQDIGNKDLVDELVKQINLVIQDAEKFLTEADSF
ncbi:ATP-binding protein [Vibrio fluminensis]|uniref:ATP-binding protein n=1 Tax=Vibrio fluminensis TaxID=2783614 RepID=UPI001888BAF5|nr:transporter substrate-binding domain-containing protein [Vibrio fluminensis]